jgi:hypothetical protein
MRKKRTELSEIQERISEVSTQFGVPLVDFPIPTELQKLALMSEANPQLNIYYLVFGYGPIRRDADTEFFIDTESIKKAGAESWARYFAGLVKTFRNKANISQKELGQEMWNTGIYKGTGIANFVTRVEAGRVAFRFMDFIALVLALRHVGVPVKFSAFFGEKNNSAQVVLEQEVAYLRKEIELKDQLIDSYKTMLKS